MNKINLIILIFLGSLLNHSLAARRIKRNEISRPANNTNTVPDFARLRLPDASEPMEETKKDNLIELTASTAVTALKDSPQNTLSSLNSPSSIVPLYEPLSNSKDQSQHLISVKLAKTSEEPGMSNAVQISKLSTAVRASSLPLVRQLQSEKRTNAELASSIAPKQQNNKAIAPMLGNQASGNLNDQQLFGDNEHDGDIVAAVDAGRDSNRKLSSGGRNGVTDNKNSYGLLKHFTSNWRNNNGAHNFDCSFKNGGANINNNNNNNANNNNNNINDNNIAKSGDNMATGVAAGKNNNENSYCSVVGNNDSRDNNPSDDNKAYHSNNNNNNHNNNNNNDNNKGDGASIDSNMSNNNNNYNNNMGYNGRNNMNANNFFDNGNVNHNLAQQQQQQQRPNTQQQQIAPLSAPGTVMDNKMSLYNKQQQPQQLQSLYSKGGPVWRPGANKFTPIENVLKYANMLLYKVGMDGSPFHAQSAQVVVNPNLSPTFGSNMNSNPSGIPPSIAGPTISLGASNPFETDDGFDTVDYFYNTMDTLPAIHPATAVTTTGNSYTRPFVVQQQYALNEPAQPMSLLQNALDILLADEDGDNELDMLCPMHHEKKNTALEAIAAEPAAAATDDAKNNMIQVCSCRLIKKKKNA